MFVKIGAAWAALLHGRGGGAGDHPVQARTTRLPQPPERGHQG